MPPLIIGVVAGLVALYGMAGWVMSWGQGTGLLVTGLVATAVLTATAIGAPSPARALESIRRSGYFVGFLSR